MTIIETPATSASEPSWQQLRELTPAVSQQVFRAIMDAFARPGTVHRLPVEVLPASVPAAVLPVLALADIMTPISPLASDDPEDSDAVTHAVDTIGRVVGARVVAVPQARYALALAESSEMSELSVGTHWSPEMAATLVQRVGTIRVAGGESRWLLSGPGIPKDAPVVLSVDGLSERFVAAREQLVSDYPAGIDSILISDDGTIIALSRTTRIELI